MGVWSVLLHPWRAARMQAESAERISLLEDEVKSLSLKLDESCSRLETVGADIEILERQLEEERAKTAGHERQLADRAGEISYMREQLEEKDALLRGQDEQIAQIQVLFSRVEEARERYERRIANLRERLADSQNALYKTRAEADAAIEQVDLRRVAARRDLVSRKEGIIHARAVSNPGTARPYTARFPGAPYREAKVRRDDEEVLDWYKPLD